MNRPPARLPLAVSMGDPAGIGLDITLAAVASTASRELPPFVLYADPAAVDARARQLRCDVVIREVDVASLPPAADRLLLVNPVVLTAAAICGEPDRRNAPAIIAAIEMAVGDIRRGLVAGLVTNPIAKKPLIDAGFQHPGHTEFLGELAERLWGKPARPVMMLTCDELRVVPVTVHIPLRQVPQRLDTKLIVETARITITALATDFGLSSPRLVIAGLNPHAGEGGTMGTEETTIIAPAIAELHRQGYAVGGPFSADTLFHPAARATYDAALCMYHDQALIPIKTLAFDRGVNVTLGLPFIRTSPDHGTAFPLAGTGKALPTSLVEALRLAERLANRRLATTHAANV